MIASACNGAENGKIPPMQRIIAVSGVAIFTLFCEAVLWLLYRLRIRGMEFRSQRDLSSLRMTAPERMGHVAVTHALLLTIFECALFLLFW